MTQPGGESGRGSLAENPWLLRAGAEGFLVNDITHTLHYLLKILENMQRVDGDGPTEEAGETP